MDWHSMPGLVLKFLFDELAVLEVHMEGLHSIGNGGHAVPLFFGFGNSNLGGGCTVGNDRRLRLLWRGGCAFGTWWGFLLVW